MAHYARVVTLRQGQHKAVIARVARNLSAAEYHHDDNQFLRLRSQLILSTLDFRHLLTDYSHFVDGHLGYNKTQQYGVLQHS